MKQPDTVLAEIVCKNKFRCCRIELLQDGKYWLALYDRSHTVLTVALKPEQFDVLFDAVERFRSVVSDRSTAGDEISCCPVPLGPEPSKLGN